MARYARPCFLLPQARNPPLVALAILAGVGIVHTLMYGVQGASLSELFAAPVRSTGPAVSGAWRLGSAVGSRRRSRRACSSRRRAPPARSWFSLVLLVRMMAVSAIPETKAGDITAAARLVAE